MCDLCSAVKLGVALLEQPLAIEAVFLFLMP